MTSTSEYFTAADTEVGRMIEGHYAWNEWCPEHATEQLMRGTTGDVNHRSIDIHEVLTASREYKCYRCGKALWAKPEPTMPKDPFPKPSGGSIVKDAYSA